MINISPVPEKLITSPGIRADQKASDVMNGIEKAENDSELRKACADFESLFLYKLMQTMRKTVPESGLMDGGLTEDIYTDMLDERIANMAANGGRGTGLGERLYSDLKRAYGEQVLKSTGIYGEGAGLEEEI